jgi:hypothetical protein
MKNEPVVSYNHMQDDDSNNRQETENIPMSLYMLLVVDALLISGLVVFAAKIIF